MRYFLKDAQNIKNIHCESDDPPLRKCTQKCLISDCVTPRESFGSCMRQFCQFFSSLRNRFPKYSKWLNIFLTEFVFGKCVGNFSQCFFIFVSIPLRAPVSFVGDVGWDWQAFISCRYPRWRPSILLSCQFASRNSVLCWPRWPPKQFLRLYSSVFSSTCLLH